jgi:ferredoxin
MKFEGGVGSYILDFSGSLENEVEVDIKVGLGSITISIPDDIGVKIFYEESFISSIDFPKDIKEKEENKETHGMTNIAFERRGLVELSSEARKGKSPDTLLQQILMMDTKSRLEFWQRELNKCIKCYGCRDVCPTAIASSSESLTPYISYIDD